MRGFSSMLRKVMSASARPEPRSTLIAATRDDGLGGRLLAMVNAKSLADALGYRFGFTWNDKAIVDKTFHIVDVVEAIFSPEFIERHWLGRKIKAADFGVLDNRAFTRSSLDISTRRGNYQGWICNEFNVWKSFHGEGADRVRRSETLRAFGFSQSVKQAIGAADKSPFPGPVVALHLRSGDIVRGKFRVRLDFGDKVIPSTLAKAIVSKLSSQGLTTLLIGQDRPTLEYLKSETGALLTDDFGADEFADQTLKAFFEMALMARCQQIYAGSSVFATIASVMGDVPCNKPKTLFSKRRAADIILDELKSHQADYHPLEAAFGYQAAFLSLEDKVSPRQAREILEKARELDPENDVYALKIAAAYFRERDYSSGEAVLKSVMISQFRDSADMPLQMMRILTGWTWRGHVMSKDFERFFAAAKAGYPHAAACSAHIFQDALKDAESASKMAALALAAEPENEIFKKIGRQLGPLTTGKSGALSKLRSRLWKAGLRI